MNREYLIGISVTPESYTLGLIDLSGKIVKLVHNDILVQKNKKRYLRELLADALKMKKGRVIGVGVSVPAYLDTRDNIMPSSEQFNWKQMHLQTELNNMLNIPVFLATRSDCISMAEAKGGIARKVSFLVTIDVSDEILMSVMDSNKTQKTPTNHNYRLGHMIVNENTTPQKNIGCLNYYGSIHGIEKRYSGIRKDPATFSEIVKEAKKVKKVRVLLDDAVDALSAAIANVSNLLAPEQIILSSASPDMEPYLSKAATKAEELMFTTPLRKPDIQISHLSDAAVLGAATMVKR